MTNVTKTVIQALPSESPVKDVLAVFEEDGCVILKNYLTADQVRAFNAEIEPQMRRLTPGCKQEEYEIMAEFHGQNTKRLTGLANISKTFREEILDLDVFHAMGDAIFQEESGTCWLTTAQVIEIGPDSRAQPLHRDLEGWTHFLKMGRASPEIVINFLVALTDFTEENGATRVIPGSHKWPDYADRGTPDMTIPVEMKAGDAVLFTGKLVHGGGANRTKDFFRRGVTIPLIPGFLTPEEAVPLLVDIEAVRTLPERVQRVLGFRSQYPVGSIGLWQANVGDIGEYLGL
ncbi:phytanoyl-CoA dioxygenase family protein [Cupriavidus necator]|uniref:Phytanoyl-CoA dioxygenase n=1 Tax=Cupriavidus pinatubonensis (strain JMP 134 / LMG 1197) TaxID=264198 RepID=Q46MD5_CUPPJ|nr:phytanoyl-CoA dioxygenase family protein [Cupriavidus necator]